MNITEEEWRLFSQKLTLYLFKAQDLVVREEMIAQHIYFIDKGLMRSYYIEDGKEVNTYFACDGALMTVFSSFITQKPSVECLEAMEDCVVYALSYQDLYGLYTAFPKFERLGRILAEQNYLCILERTLLMQTKTAKQRYLDFIENSPLKLVQRVPLYQIASFLGIAPESLSRIRREMVTS